MTMTVITLTSVHGAASWNVAWPSGTRKRANVNEITTLDLARMLARAARRATDDEDGATAVLETLHRASSWFCRVSEDAAGLTQHVAYDVRSESRARTTTSSDQQQPGLFDT
jgi:hypothetical protein